MHTESVVMTQGNSYSLFHGNGFATKVLPYLQESQYHSYKGSHFTITWFSCQTGVKVTNKSTMSPDKARVFGVKQAKFDLLPDLFIFIQRKG